MRPIDAEHLKRWIMLKWESCVSVGYDDVKTNEILEQIDRELTIEPERKNGKWIKDGHHIQCNQCGISICDKDREGDVLPKNFCPNCGSYNGGEEDE